MIYYFSGTGNSLHVAEQLAKTLGERLISIADCLSTGDVRHTLEPGEKIGFVFPIYSWGPAPVVIDFIKRWHIYEYDRNTTYCYMVGVCGDEVGLSVEMWRKALGFIRGNAAFSIQMPNNYILLPGFDVDSKDLENSKRQAAGARIKAIAEAVNACSTVDDVVVGPMPWLKSKLVYPLFKRFYMSDRPFCVQDEKCTHCGLCEKVCPNKNISMKDGTPKWQGNCAMCLSCIHRCPAKAIQYGKITHKKGRYHF